MAILTPIDELISIVNEKKEMSAKDCSEFLNVSQDVLMEWAEILEEKGILKIEYKFTRPFLVAVSMSKTDFENKTKEISESSEIDKRKIDSLIELVQNYSKVAEYYIKYFSKISDDELIKWRKEIIKSSSEIVTEEKELLLSLSELKKNIEKLPFKSGKEKEKFLSEINLSLETIDKKKKEFVEKANKIH